MNGASGSPAAFDSPKLRAQTEVLERRLDELTTTLESAIAEIEAGTLEPRLGSWLSWVAQRRLNPVVTLALAGPDLRARLAALPDAAQLDGNRLALAGAALLFSAEYPGAAALPSIALPANAGVVALLDLAAIVADAFVLGTLRRECAGAIWLGDGASVPSEVAALFRDAPLGIVSEPDAALSEILARQLPAPAVAPLAALTHARMLAELAAGTQAEHARESARLALQTAVAERAKTSHALGDELAARRELSAQIRDDLNRDLQGALERLAHASADLDSALVLRGPVKRAMDEVPALSTAPGKLVHVSDFEQEQRYHWYTGTFWQKFEAMFPRKMRLSIPAADLAKLSNELTTQLNALISKPALRMVDAFNGSLDDFGDVAASAGVTLAPARIDADERARWDRKVSGPVVSRGTGGGSGIALADRSKRAIDAACERDVKAFHVDIERRGPMGRIMEARTAVMGLSFLVMTTIRVSGAWGQIEKWMSSSKPAAGAAAGASQGIPWGLFFNAALIGVFFILLGLVVNAITESGKEGAQISEKVHEARDALEDKLVSVMERFVAGEFADLKTAIADHKARALERIDRAIDAQKQEIDELDRKNRAGGSGLRTARTGLAALPLGLRGDVDKTAAAVKDVRAELAARYAAVAAVPAPAPAVSSAPSAVPPPATPPPASAPSATAPSATAAASPRPDAAAALAALQARVAARAAAAKQSAPEAG
ncbi:MAG TPA: hypothetical protein VGX96_11920 [Candidatus Elarobacter sp.]|nr:hypothetical protein [Candidatus Elarobacter sp.]